MLDAPVAADDKKKGGSVFGRFFRNIGFRKSNRKGSYKQHQGKSLRLICVKKKK